MSVKSCGQTKLRAAHSKTRAPIARPPRATEIPVAAAPPREEDDAVARGAIEPEAATNVVLDDTVVLVEDAVQDSQRNPHAALKIVSPICTDLAVN